MSEVESLLIQLKWDSAGKKFHFIKYCGVVFPIKSNVNELSDSDLEEIREALRILNKFVDFHEIGHGKRVFSEWKKDELYNFLNAVKGKQKEILSSLAKSGKIGGKELFQKLFPNLEFDKHKMWKISTKIGGLHRRARDLGKDKLVFREQERTINGYEYQYWLSPRYESWVKEYFKDIIGQGNVSETEQALCTQVELQKFLTE